MDRMASETLPPALRMTAASAWTHQSRNISYGWTETYPLDQIRSTALESLADHCMIL
jgi:hypothetical protein